VLLQAALQLAFTRFFCFIWLLRSINGLQALELRDKAKEYMGKGVSQAVDNVNKIIAPRLIGMDPRDQKRIDDLMVQQLDGSKNEWGWSKSKLGANAILAVSIAVCRAG